jgi:outer membrane protein OmpA-like peptidoglycan-associated protein
MVLFLAVLLMCGWPMGCSLCNPKPQAGPLMEKQAAEVPEIAPQVERPEPTPTPAVEPVVTPAPVPPAVVEAVKDLDETNPGLFTFDKDKGLFQFKSDTLFASGSSIVRPKAKAALMKLAEILNKDEVKDRSLTIVGHTDTDRVIKPATIANLKKLGKPVNNQGLSEARAEAVAKVLATGGIDAGRMSTEGKGQTQPIGDNHTPAGKAKNRRVSIYLTPMSK